MDKIRLMKKTFYNEEEVKKKLCKFILGSDILSMNKKCKEFEIKFSEYQGRKYSVLYNSGSSANLALLQALLNKGVLKKGDRIGFSALTWATNVMPIIQLGLRPIPIDINPKTLCVSPENLKNTINKSGRPIKALFLTHLLGFSDDIKSIRKICKVYNITLLEDTCESLGSEVDGIKLGNFGLASSFSFFVGHHLSCIEGGMVCTDDKELYNHLLMVRAHGWSRKLDNTKKRKLQKENDISDFYNGYTFYNLGYNLRPTEITGFIGCEQLKYIETINKKRNKNFLKYQKAKQDFDFSHMSFVSNFAYPVIFDSKEELEIAKKKFENVEIRPIVGGSILEQPFYNGKKYNCPNARKVHELGFYIPNNPDLTKEEVEAIVDKLK